jgi:GIY-YIG catalytic domain
VARQAGGGRRPRPRQADLPAPQVREFRQLLTEALNATDVSGRRWADAKWGVYAFYDYEGEPIYVGQTNEQLRVRVRRHLTNQRTDAVAMSVLDVFEVAAMRLWPLWQFQDIPGDANRGGDATRAAQEVLNRLEYTVYLRAIEESRYKAILNEVIPAPTDILGDAEMPATTEEPFPLVSDQTRQDRGHPDVRIERRARNTAELAAKVHERGEVSPGLRRVLVIQAARLTLLAATRLAETDGRAAPDAAFIDTRALVGTVTEETDAGDEGEQHAGEAEIES